MAPSDRAITTRYANTSAELASVKPLWGALHAHHAEITPSLGGQAPKRDAKESWRLRKAKYECWLKGPETFFVVAEDDGRPIGYAFVTIGLGYASWSTGERLAELQTLSVLPEHRGAGVGRTLLEAVWARLAEIGVDDLAITTAVTNVGSHRFYERHGFTASFVVYYGRPARK